MDIGKNESLKLVKETAPTLYQKKKKEKKIALGLHPVWKSFKNVSK